MPIIASVRGWFLRFADRLSASYWFIPSVMAFLAVVLATALVLLDAYTGSAWMDHVPGLYQAHAEGARQMLSAIGGSMITVAGTVFSVTIVAIVYASGQYGPRLLTNFMKDRGNQVTLGTFIATFLYCLVVLRTIRSANESGGYSFVPDIALLVAVALALCSIAVLIFFIHHVPSRIHINSVIEAVGHRLLKEIDHQFPRFIGDPPDEKGKREAAARMPAIFMGDVDDAVANRLTAIPTHKTGYIDYVDDEALISEARAADLVLKLQYQPGDFTHKGRTLVEAWPPGRCDEKVASALRSCFSISASRSALQDLRFLIDELVEIAARALSPGVNDPFTAVTCLDWLGAALSDLIDRDMPSHLRVDNDGALRIIAHPQSFAGFLQRSFGALAQYVAGDMIAALRYLEVLGSVALDCAEAKEDRLPTISTQVDRLEALAKEKLTGINLSRVARRADQLRRALGEPDYRRKLRDGTAWLGGTS